MNDRAPERACFVADPARVPADLEGCTRLYVGSEFCWRRLPDPSDLPGAVAGARARGLDFSLVTPLLDEQGLEAVLRLVEALPREGGVEVVANDVGLIHALARERWGGTLVAGRLLTRQRRGPGFREHGDPTGEARAALRRSALDGARWVEWLVQRYGVRRFELDSLVQGVELDPQPGGVGVSLYHPWLFVTTSRRCPWRFDGRRWRPREDCPAPCHGRLLELVPEEGGRTLVLGGCAQFLRSDVEPPPVPGVDRLVWQPAVPA